MRIMITGAAGQLGNELISILESGKAEIGLIDGVYGNTQIIPADIDNFDISDMDSTRTFIKNAKPDIIINCAAMTNVDGCETARDVAFKVNALGVRNLAICAKEVDAKLIHISTDYVFAGNGNRPYCEWDMINPQSAYGASKALGEKYALTFSDKTFIVRTS